MRWEKGRDFLYGICFYSRREISLRISRFLCSYRRAGTRSPRPPRRSRDRTCGRRRRRDTWTSEDRYSIPVCLPRPGISAFARRHPGRSWGIPGSSAEPREPTRSRRFPGSAAAASTFAMPLMLELAGRNIVLCNIIDIIEITW